MHDVWAIGTNVYFKVYGIVIFLFMCTTMNLSFTWEISILGMSIVGLLMALLFFFFYPTKFLYTKSNCRLCVMYIIFLGYLLFVSTNFTVDIIRYLTYGVCGCSVILLPDYLKARLLRIFTLGTCLILLISIPAWLLYLLGFSLPHGSTDLYENGFHILTNYYFFLLNGYPGEQLIPRFTSMFLEPGQLATPCVFLIFANDANFRKKEVILLFIAVILSFSLIGYGLLLGGLFLKSLMSQKYRVLKILSFLIVVASLFLYINSSRNKDENAFYALIISRLEYDEEKGIAGNNRTTMFFDNQYSKMFESGDQYLGIADKIDPNFDWTNNPSGWKKFVVKYGLVGLILFSFFCLILLFKDWSLQGFIYFIVMIVAFIPRSMLPSPYWLYVSIVAFPLLKMQQRCGLKRNFDVN